MIIKRYAPCSPTLEAFHRCDAQSRAIVGPIGSGKTTAAIWEIGFNLPRRIFMDYGISETRWFVVRKTYDALMDSDFTEAMDWFCHGEWKPSRKLMTIKWPSSANCPSPLIVHLKFLSCNTPEEEGKFRSQNVTGAWIDEANQLALLSKQIIKGRLGRYPKASETPTGFVPRYFLETSNPFPANHPMYTTYDWMGPKIVLDPAPQWKCTNKECDTRFSLMDKCPVCGAPGELTGKKDWRTGVYDCSVLEKKFPTNGPIPAMAPTADHIGFWQEPGENEENLRPHYWDAMRRDYAETPEMVSIMVEGEPGDTPRGKPVYRNFDKNVHIAKAPLVWKKERDPRTGEMRGVPLLCGWDFSGNFPAAVVVQRVGPMQYQVLKEFYNDRMQAVDFGKWVIEEMAVIYPGYEGVNYADPASWSPYSSSTGGFTSNALMVSEQCGIDMTPSRQELDLRISAVDQLLIRRNGLLIDQQCYMICNGFTAGYVREHNPRLGEKDYKENPLKNNFSHCFVGETWISTPHGDVPIVAMREGDEVVTPYGNRRVLKAWMTRKNSQIVRLSLSNGESIDCTSDHKVYTRKGLAMVSSLQYGDVLIGIETKEEWKLWQERVDQQKTNVRCLRVGSFIERLRDIIRRTTQRVVSTCIGLSGCFIMEQSQRKPLFITSTVTRQTIESRTFRPWVSLNTLGMMFSNTTRNGPREWAEESGLLKRQRGNGMVPRKDYVGIKIMAREHGSDAEQKDTPVFIAVSNTRNLRESSSVGFVARLVRALRDGGAALITFPGRVRSAVRLLRLTSIADVQPVVRVVNVRPLAEQRDVYNLTVEGDHCYFANGILVSNCHDALQYALVTEIYPKVKEPRPEIAEEEALIESYPPRMSGYSYAGKTRKREVREYTEARSDRATGWDPRPQKGRR